MTANTIKRSGGIDGKISSKAFPFFAFVKWGADSSRTNDVNGRFAYTFVQNGGYYKTGCMMPIALIEDEIIKKRLLDAVVYLKTLSTKNLARTRRKFQAYLDKNGLDMIRIDSASNLPGWIQLNILPSFFENMIPHLHYVTALEVDSQAIAHIHESKPATWRNPADIAFWLLGWDFITNHRCESFELYLALDDIVYSDTHPYHRRNYELSFLGSDLSQFFQLKNDIPISTLNVWISETKHGWAEMKLTIDGNVYEIVCSNAYDPLEALLALARCADLGDLPVALKIDEEGTDKRLEVFQTDTDDKVYFVLSDPNSSNEALIVQAIFDKSVFVSTFKTAFRDFFEHRYDASQWEWYPDDQLPTMKDRVLNDPWMNS